MKKLCLLLVILFATVSPAWGSSPAPDVSLPEVEAAATVPEVAEAVEVPDASDALASVETQEVTFLTEENECYCNCRCPLGYELQVVFTSGTCSSLNWQSCNCTGGGSSYFDPCV